MIFTQLTDGVLNAAATPFKVIYTCIWYIICAFLVFTVHDFAQALAAKAFGDKSIKLSFHPVKQIKNTENWISTACIVLFWAGWKKTIDTADLSRPKKMLVALSGPISCGILCIPAFSAWKAVNLLYHTSLGNMADIFVVPFSALFIALTVICIFSLFPLPPYDGGIFLAQLLPWDIRDKFINVFDNKISLLIFIITIAFTTQQGLTRTLLENIYLFLGNTWNAVFGG